MQGLEKYRNRLTTSRRRIDAMGADGDGAPRELFGGTLYYLDATFELSCIEATWGLCTKLAMTASSKESRAV